MLTELRIKNFKAWQDTGSLRMAPLTIIFGANSAGKSSLGHLLLGLKQTALLTDRRRALHLGDAHSQIDLGTFADCLHGHDLSAKLEFTLSWTLPQAMNFWDPLSTSPPYSGDEIRLQSILHADARGLPALESFTFTLSGDDNAEPLVAKHGVGDDGKAYLEVSPMNLVTSPGREWPLASPEKFYRFAEVTLARYQNASSLTQFSLEAERLLTGLTYLGPLREPPKRTYSWAGDTVLDVGPRGEFAVSALLAAMQEERAIQLAPGQAEQSFDELIASWLHRLGIIHSFSVQPIAQGRKEYEVLIKTHKDAPEVKLTDVGFGVSQILPVLVQAFYAPPYSTVWMEQPEVHLHPQVQAELADAFISAIQAHENGEPRNVQLVVESHSEHFLLRLQRRIAEGSVSPEDVVVYFANRTDRGLDLETLRLNAYGEIENWPDNFFGDEMGELAARTQAAMERRKQQRKTTHD